MAQPPRQVRSAHQQVPGSEARHEHGKPGRVQVEVDENLISTLLGSQSGCHVRGCRWACGLDAAMDSRAGSGTCDWLPQVLGARRPGKVRPEPGKAVQLLPHLPFHRIVDTCTEITALLYGALARGQPRPSGGFCIARRAMPNESCRQERDGLLPECDVRPWQPSKQTPDGVMRSFKSAVFPDQVITALLCERFEISGT